MLTAALSKTLRPVLKAISAATSLTSSNALDRLGFVSVIFPALPCQNSIQFSSLLSCFISSLLCCLYLGGFQFDTRKRKGRVILKTHQRSLGSFYFSAVKGKVSFRRTHVKTVESCHAKRDLMVFVKFQPNNTLQDVSRQKLLFRSRAISRLAHLKKEAY